jgi:cytosine/adenosine deaminase-related metal-dependent hydrolase
MLDRGIAVSLAVDGASSNDSSDMLGELRQCLLVLRILSGVASMPADDVFWMATRGGASVLGREDIGSLKVGKAADIALFDMRQIGYAGAAADPLAALLFCGNNHTARTVIVNGQVVVENGKLTGADEDEIVRTTNTETERLLHCD